MELKRYLLKRNETELREIEKDLAEYLGVPFVKCSYDCVNSHKYQNNEEMKYRKENVEDADAESELYDDEDIDLDFEPDDMILDNDGLDDLDL